MEFLILFFLTSCHCTSLFRFDALKNPLEMKDDQRRRSDYSKDQTLTVDDYYDQLIDIRNLDDKNNEQKSLIPNIDHECTKCGKHTNNSEESSKSHRSISIHNKYKFKPIAGNKAAVKDHKTSKVFDDNDPFKEITYYMNDYIPGNDMLRYESFPDPWAGTDNKIQPKPIKGVARELNSKKTNKYYSGVEEPRRDNEDFILSNSQEPDEMKYKIWNALRNIRSWINN